LLIAVPEMGSQAARAVANRHLEETDGQPVMWMTFRGSLTTRAVPNQSPPKKFRQFLPGNRADHGVSMPTLEESPQPDRAPFFAWPSRGKTAPLGRNGGA